MNILSSLPWKSRIRMPFIGNDEKIIRSTRHHWLKHVPPVCIYLLFFLLCIALFFASTYMRAEAPALSLPLFFISLLSIIIVQHWFFHMMLSENVTDVILTNKRILYFVRNLWFVERMDELILDKIKMVEVDEEGLIRYLFDYGDLSCRFDIVGGQTIPFVPSPQTWAEDIERIIHIG